MGVGGIANALKMKKGQKLSFNCLQSFQTMNDQEHETNQNEVILITDIDRTISKF